MFDPRNVFCAGTRFWSAQHKRYGNEPEEGETTQTAQKGMGSVRKTASVRACVCSVCARVREYERFGFDTQP